LERLQESAEGFIEDPTSQSAQIFEKTVVNSFVDKLRTGISVAAFPQFRDMNGMFLSTFTNLEKVKGGYMEVGQITLKNGYCKLPEVAAIEKNAKKIEEMIQDSFHLRVCVTGPYTLSSFFPYRNSQIYEKLGGLLSEIISENIFSTNHGRVELISIDEPLFGLLDDPLIDRGAEGRASLLEAWKIMTGKAHSKNVKTCMHLHSTTDDLYWAVEALDIIESHVDDPLYLMKNTGKLLEEKDKKLKASIAITDFDLLIRRSIESNASESAVADAWKKISSGSLKPEVFLEKSSIMRKRLVEIIDRFGRDRIDLAGPECGLRGFPTYGSALKCLKNVSQATVLYSSSSSK
jgi:methionine synthase II (cobalamin-independent)